jgi:hypothetical protein
MTSALILPKSRKVAVVEPSKPGMLRPKHAGDPGKELLRKVGDISDFELFHNSVLVAIYLRPNVATLGGKDFHLSDKTRDEDKFQGIVGLVLKKGPAAFVEDANQRFYGCDVAIGDWVFFRASDGVAMKVNGVLCKRVVDVLIEGRIPHPDYVY